MKFFFLNMPDTRMPDKIASDIVKELILCSILRGWEETAAMFNIVLTCPQQKVAPTKLNINLLATKLKNDLI